VHIKQDENYANKNNYGCDGKYQLSLTNPHDMLHHSKHAADIGGRSV